MQCFKIPFSNEKPLGCFLFVFTKWTLLLEYISESIWDGQKDRRRNSKSFETYGLTLDDTVLPKMICLPMFGVCMPLIPHLRWLSMQLHLLWALVEMSSANS